MTRSQERPAQSAPPAVPSASPIATALWIVVVAASVAIPLFIAPTDIDAFRVPKDLLYEAFAAVCLALVMILLLYRRRETLSLLRAHADAVSLAGAVIGWTAVTTLLSTNRDLSVLSLVWVASAVVMFIATLLVAGRGRGFGMLGGVFLAAAINAVLALLQRANIYNPLQFAFWIPIRIRTTGLVGNPNDLGTYLLFPAIGAAVCAIVARDRRRAWTFGAISAVLAAGMLATATLTAIAAYGCAMAALIAFRTRRVVLAFALVVVCAFVLFATVGPLRRRAMEVAANARAGRYIQIMSLRAPAFAAAVEMFKDHPVIGVGPGCFGWWYLPYKQQLNERYPSFYVAMENFSETHNDHLQTLAVSGLPGYLILLASVGMLVRLSLRTRDDGDAAELTERRQFSAAIGLPFAVAFVIVAFAQFPLQLTSTASVIAHLAALSVAWRRE